MPRRTDLTSVLVIGSGPIVIGQAAEFDYSGTQACRVLREEGLRVVLVNSNPATIMTDPEFADATYVEPITPEFVEKVIAKERPDALLATLGGQTALNAAMSLAASGVLEKYGVELIGASIEAIEKGENRESFKAVVESLPPEWGAEVSRSVVCHTLDDCFAAIGELGYPVVVRPSFTMGGLGSGLAYDEADLRRIAGSGLAASPTTEVLLEESILGWKEYELEVMRDRADNVVIVCSIENLDPMGVHTGDSITVGPAMTLTDREYQRLRDISIGVIREVGVDTGGCNIQFAVNPADGRVVVIEMNPRVSRSSALASKATGFPIAKIAAKVAIGYTLDEIPNDITEQTPASFEPTLDYVVVKVPRFAFEKFPAADHRLTTHMKSVGEAMALGRCFTEALNKALRSLERPASIFSWTGEPGPVEELLERIRVPHEGRLCELMEALRAGATAQQVQEATGIDPWFVDQLALIDEVARAVTDADELSPAVLRLAKRHGFSDAQVAGIRGLREDVVRGRPPRPRHPSGLQDRRHLRRRVRRAHALPLLSYDEENEVAARERPAVLILGSGPNRIGQGIEFDYSCVHACLALSAAGYETVMVNCNPRRCPPTTTPPTGSTSSRSRWRTCSRSCTSSSRPARSPASSSAGRARRRSASPRGCRTPACRSSAPRRPRSTSRRSAAPSGRCWPGPGCRRPSTAWPPPTTRPRRSPTRSATRSWCAPLTCSAVAGWRSSTMTARSPTTSPGRRRSRRTTRCSSTGSSTTPWRSTSTPCTTAPSCISAA
jgi:carbamoyl-phosphate synthase large subunit